MEKDMVSEQKMGLGSWNRIVFVSIAAGFILIS
jgi:hypothetical protein